jgi:hypothetical protein
MRLVILITLMLAFGSLVLLGLLHLVRELLSKDVFQPPSMPGETAKPDSPATRQAASHSTHPTAGASAR